MLNPKHDKIPGYTKLRYAGVSLIEVLVTVLIMSVGLMGLASLQANSLKNGLDSSRRSQGVWIMEEIISRMRANDAGLATGYTAAAANGALCGNGPAKLCADNFNGGARSAANATCSADEMAEFDVWEVFCGYDNGDDVISNSTDAVNITNYSITCGAAPCPTTANFTISISWVSKSVTDQTANQANYAEDAVQTITHTIRP
jgi:type IV pilus assembly protein PilV